MSYTSELIQKQAVSQITNDEDVQAAERQFTREVLRLFREYRNNLDLQQIEEDLATRNIVSGLIDFDEVGIAIASVWAIVFFDSADAHIRRANQALDQLVSFDRADPGVLTLLQQVRNRIVPIFSENQLRASRIAVSNAVQRGLSPLNIARAFRDSIGLSPRLQLALINYRSSLEQNSARALRNALRDQRFDDQVEAAIRRGEPLTESQINRISSRYRNNLSRFRAESIGISEALAAVNAGANEVYTQLMNRDIIENDQIVRTWFTARDERVRSAHNFMDGQERDGLTPFVSGAGNLLRYPGDEQAPLSETRRCRCRLRIDILN